MKVVLAGGSGSLGRRIADVLAARGDEVVVLTRTVRPGAAHRQVAWDGVTVGEWADELSGAAVVNLAGRLVGDRPTAANIALLTSSRVEPTRALAEAAALVAVAPPVWVQMSTMAIYGDGGDRPIAETAPVADGPAQMAGVARPWEAAAEGVRADRQVVLRTGIVLDRDSHALDMLATLVRAGLGGRWGTGRQWVSWLHIDDLLAIVLRALDDPAISGVVNATSPRPVRNAELMAALRNALRRPIGLASPEPLLRLGAVLLRTDPELALLGRRGVPEKLLSEGFTFAYPDLAPALEDLLRRS
ncbi:uncharacterized protein (TIGR01777 family) [Allocatelliglobosispora scoriae]|uniref:Uncharacterized protein (TIGR01777 family) n=1 Tax=Allocatelliglobosispora scoriae TaxID=643052 RepID=A0A841BXI8_9ACTN|nr:TIGR01777 family oxidoreductase [Allocatelliglobosispora scoriae]MBB5872874.1 uncharacterized protein (TIGR01777 family) [Allocatelliglobosispora scoriae]